MQPFGCLRDVYRLPTLFESSQSSKIGERLSVTRALLAVLGEGQSRHLCQPDGADSRPIFLESCIPVTHQFEACHSSAPCNGYPFSHPTILPSQHYTIAALQHTAAGPVSKPYHQRAPASACTLTAAHLPTSHLSIANVARGHLLHTSAAASQDVPPLSETMQSEPGSQLESAVQKQKQQQHSGPDISLLNAVQQRQWDHASNAHLGNILVRPQSNRTAYWTCSRCPSGLPHKWHASISNVFQSSKRNTSGCPYCSGQAVCAHNSLAQQAPHLVVEWDTLRNADTPHDYTSKSEHRAHWVCANGHHWQTRIANRVHYNKGCPDCAKARDRKRAPTLTNSSDHIMQVWDHAENGKAGLHPGKLTCGSYKRAHFICPKGHQWTARICSVAVITNTTGCPACSGCSRSKHQA